MAMTLYFIQGCRFGIFGMDIGYEDAEETSRTVSYNWVHNLWCISYASPQNCFIYWSPNDSTPREKMMTMSTKSKFKEKLGCEIEIQIFDNSDLEIENIGTVIYVAYSMQHRLLVTQSMQQRLCSIVYA